MKIILCAALCLCSRFPAVSQESGARFSLTVSSREVKVGDSISVKLSVFDALPADVMIELPPYGGVFRIENTRKELVQTTFSPSTLFTIEYVALVPGTHAVGPIVIIVNGKERFVTAREPIEVFDSARAAQDRAGLRWKIVSGSDSAGVAEALVIVLEGYHPGSRKSLEVGLSENALLETIPLPKGYTPEAPWEALLAKKMTPLAAGSLSLPSAVLSYSTDGKANAGFIMAHETKINVSRLPGVSSKADKEKTRLNSQTLDRAFRVQEDNGEGVITDDPEDIRLAVYEARKTEYGSLFQRSARERRLSLEDQYSLLPSLSVPPGAWKAPSVFLAISVLLLSIFLRFPFFKALKFRLISTVLTIAGLLLSVWSFYVYILDRYPAAVVSETSLYLVPEQGTTVIEKLNSGNAVRVMSEAGDWFYTETATGARGWLERDKTFVYTGSD